MSQEDASSRRWGLYVDIEGFSAMYGTSQRGQTHAVQALAALASLVEGVHRLITRPPKGFPSIGAHQMGDGFIIVSHCCDEPPIQPVALAVALMRHVLQRGFLCKAGISVGDFHDIGGCYRSGTGEALGNNLVIRHQSNVMTLYPVIGSALINAFKIQGREPRGPLLLVDRDFLSEQIASSLGLLTMRVSPRVLDVDVLAVNWLRTPAGPIRPALESLGLANTSPLALSRRLQEKIQSVARVVGDDWLQNARCLL